MDKVQDMNNSFNHGLTITERKNLIISGVKKIESLKLMQKHRRVFA